MTSNSDPGGQLELKFCMHASVMGHYECTNFHQNQRGSGTEVCDLTWNDPEHICADQAQPRDACA